MQVVSISSVKKSWIDLHEKLKLLATLKRLTKKNTKTEMCKKNSSKSIYNREKQYKVSLHFFESYNVAEP